MNKTAFDELLESIREGGAILCGERPASRSFELSGNTTRLEATPELSGSLKQYAGEYVPLETVRERIWSHE